jgi:hypothetical protein
MVQLPPMVGVDWASRKRVMVVVPRETKGRKARQGVVAALVFRPIWFRSEPVTNRVDTPDEMVHEEDANQAAPKEPQQQTLPRTGGECDSDSRKKQSCQRPEMIAVLGVSPFRVWARVTVVIGVDATVRVVPVDWAWKESANGGH